MTHAAHQIRSAAVALLQGLATSGDNVVEGAFRPLGREQVPGLRVWMQSEESSTATLAGGAARILERTARLMVEAIAAEAETVDDTLDAMRLDVEQALAGDNTLGGLVKWINPVGFEREADGDGEWPTVAGRMQFEIRYYTALNAPDVLL